ncbi:hypothetical protein DFH29DRAFT_985410 [Suillus ampliporus]|nr:hypothetical protein DFH29DRAFT_985410 [Suillus ampliporus]
MAATGTCHPQSGYVFGVGKNMLDRLEDDPYVYRWKINHYYPFHDEGEWELGKFLVENLTQTQMIKFLKLKWVNDWFKAKSATLIVPPQFNTHERPSFTMKDQLLDWMDSLPCFMEWKVSNIEFSGYTMVHPIELIWRNVLEVVKQLFSDPIFANHMTDYLHVGATQVPIILGSDKTHVTRITRGLEMHPVFITIGNIDSEVQSKATLQAWRCIAYMPIAKFRMHSDYQSILQAQLWHKCMDLVLANLKAAAVDGCFMPDPSRLIRYVFTPLIAHVCDLPEASMIAAVTKNASPLTMAVQGDFGDGTLHPPHTGKHMLQLLVDISRKFDPWDLDKVHMPFWHDWLFACPSVFLAGEVLHTCFKFFADHPLKWVKEAVGAYELDTRFIVQHKQVGMCHFTKGITHVKQMTGREYRDIQCTIVASITGATSPRFIHAICALIEFTYLTQNPVHSPQSLQSMEQALMDFHSFKGAIVEAEARKGKKGVKEDFFIPKLELLQSFRGTVQQLGTLMQFSADMTEHLLITHCKDLFPWTARQSKDFMEQCVRILNHQESMEIFDLYALLTSCGVSLVNAMYAKEEEVATTNPALSWISRVLPDKVNSVRGPRPVHNHFLKGILSGDALTAFQLNVTPDYKSLSPADIHMKYTLPSFDHALADFIGHSSLSSGEHTRWDPNYGRYQVRVVQAYPPSDNFPLGNCDTVLIDGMGVGGKMSMSIPCADVLGSKVELPLYLSNPLLYVQFFRFISSPNERPELMMWTVECAYTQDENGNCHREGAVMRVTDVTHAVELIPVYGEAVGNGVSSTTCLETYERFFLNNFADKESYHTFSTEFV